ncbi:MAG: ABC transporter substrate-binding protein [Actinomycetota bacterium]
MRRIATARRLAALLGAVVLVAVACSKGTPTSTTPPPGTSAPATSAPAASTSAAPASVYDQSLKGICPDPIVLQTDWFPEVEHGASYNLIGPGGTIDASAGTYSGPLKNTGVDLEIRAGGPFIGFSQPTAQMYSKPDIFMAFADTGNQIQTYSKLPAIGVVTPLEKSPQILMYNPAAYNFKTVSDVKQSGATVVYFEGAAFIDYLVGTGQLDKSQLDGSYDGSPARWVSSGGKIVQQGFATNEPYSYEHVITDWSKPVKYLLLYDAGWTIYQSNIVVKPDTVTKYHDCLAKLVPMFQQSEVDYITNPGATNDLINSYVTKMNQFWKLSTGLDDAADKIMRDQGLVGNGSDSTIGNYDFDRLTTFFDKFASIEKANGQDIPDSLTPQDIATNEFIDPNIGLPS